MVMKRVLALILAAIMLLTAAPALAVEEDHLTIGATTALSGGFFTEMWGNNTSDIDVRLLLHGYNLMKWDGAMGAYAIDDTVVSGIVVTEDDAGNRTYTLMLQEDLYYSDGTPVTAQDYAFSALLSVSPEIAQIGGAINDSNYIVGADEYKNSEAETISGVRVINDHMLSLTVKAEYLPFFYEMALLDYCPYPIHVIAPGCAVKDDGEGAYIANETAEFTAELLEKTILDPETGYQSHPSVVSGPYMLTSFDWETRTAEFEANPYYKGNSNGVKPEITYLTVKTVTNETMIDELQNGDVDLLTKCVNADTLNAGMALVAENTVSVSNYARSGYSFISYSCEKATVASAAVRQAIAHCFDKDEFVTAYVRNYGIAVDGYYGIGQWMYQLVAGSLEAPVELPENPTADEQAAYDEAVLAWEELTLDNLKTYDLDIDAAASLLESDGWTLNADGIRAKEIDGEQVALALKMIYPEGNAIGDYVDAFAANLKEVGIELTAEAVPFTELLQEYYRQTDRTSDLIYLATNFAYVYEPSDTFAVEDAYQGSNNRTGIIDEQLYQLAVDMRLTEPGDVLSYCQKWVAFQEYYTEVLPTLPVYSNVYFDFYTPWLQNYNIGADVSWAKAIVEAHIGEPVVEEEVFGEEEAEFED